MNLFRAILLSVSLMAPGVATQAETAPPHPGHLLGLSASASLEVPQDWLSITLSTSRDGIDAAAVQGQLRQALDAALAEARKAAKPGLLEVRTGGFSLNPRYSQRGVISGWVGQAELQLEGRDKAAIALLTGRLSSLTVARVAHSLSRETREKAETDLAAMAIASFRAKAADYARLFGYAGYAVREVHVSPSDGMQPVPMMRARAMAASPVEDALPVEAGKATVTLSVSGQVQMSR